MPDKTPAPHVIGYAPPSAHARGREWMMMWRQPPGWLILVPALLAFMLFMDAQSLPRGAMNSGLAAIFIGFVLAVIFLIRLIGLIAVSNADAGPVNTSRRWQWFVVPLLAALTFAAWRARLTETWAFNASLPAMHKMVADVHAAGGKLPDRKLGWYRAERITALPGGGAYFFLHDSPLGITGFAYIPPGATPPPVRQTPYRGDWYLIHDTY